MGEALTNADRHAPGGQARVTVTAEAGSLVIRVENEVETPEPARDGGLGIRSIRSRAEELGGQARVGAAPGGWLVEVELPLARVGA